MGTCCGCAVKPKAEQHPLTHTHAITYQSVSKSQYPTLLVDQQNKNHDQHGIQGMPDLPSDELCDELELNLSLRHIPKQRMLTCPCDPFIIVSIKDEAKNVYNVVGQTEIVDDNLNPDFSKDIRIHYMFEQVQYVRLDIYDANDDDDDDDDDEEVKTEDLSKHDFVGAVEFIVGDLVTANGHKLVMAIEDRNGNKLKKSDGLQAMVIVRSEEVTNNFDEVELKVSARGLPKMKFCGRIDPFFQIYRQTKDNQWASVYTSPHLKSTYCPNWPQFKIQTRRLCNGDVEKPILIKIWDWNFNALAVHVCELKTTLAQLLDSNSILYDTKNCGELLIKHAKILKKYPFVSYLSGGLEMHFLTAIDFTGSNGEPTDSQSLHYMGAPHFESQYLKVIKSVGRVLAPYDVDGDIHAYGFGANLNPMGTKQVSHCFNLTHPSSEAAVEGIEGLIEAYQHCLKKVQLYGPTYLSEIIRMAAAQSMDICRQNSQSYNILLIITDGIINDMRSTMDAIVDASGLPLSIIIVGVGEANFDNVESLDADDDPLRHSQTGQVMHRCIVKFVPFDEFKDQHISAIAREVLEEVPEQVSGFMSMHEIHPNVTQIEKNENEEKSANYYTVDVVATAPGMDETY